MTMTQDAEEMKDDASRRGSGKLGVHFQYRIACSRVDAIRAQTETALVGFE